MRLDQGPSPLIVTIRHWLPILTFCPVNKKPDLVYVSVTFAERESSRIPELYAVRKTVRDMVSMQCMFMENIAILVSALFPAAVEVTVRLAFNRHVVTYYPE